MAKSNSSSSLDENQKEKEFGLVDPQAAVEDPTEAEPRDDPRYEPIKTEKSTKDLEANTDKQSTRGSLQRMQSGSSAFTDVSEESDAKSSIRRKKWYRTNPLKWGPVPPVPKQREVSPEYTAGVFSRLTWQWMQPLMNVGYKRPLEKNDLWSVNPNRSADLLAEKLNTAFQLRLEQNHKRPLLRAMFDTFVSYTPVSYACNKLTFTTEMGVYIRRFLPAFRICHPSCCPFYTSLSDRFCCESLRCPTNWPTCTGSW